MNEPTKVPVDLTTCDREPIHLLGQIQSFGFLLGLTSDWIVSHASGNVAAFLPVDTPDALLGMPVSRVLSDAAIHAIRNRLQHLGSRAGVEIASAVEVGDDGRRYDVSIHISGGTVVLEFEPHDPSAATGDEIANVQHAIRRIAAARSVQESLGFAVRFVRALAGYDRVMAYRFLPDGSGEVVAEAAAARMEPFLNLRYPASDIPRQARALYVRNPLRVIADVGDDGAAIAPAGASVELDLSDAVLRSVSSIHLEYLRNMGVGASMSISIIVDDALWGLIACHHNAPKLLPQPTRNALLLFGQMLSLLLREKLSAQDRDLDARTRELTNAISREASAETSITRILFSHAEELMELFAADGMAMMFDGRIESAGTTPTHNEITVITRHLNRSPAGKIVESSQLSEFVPEAADFAERAAGLLSIPISKTPRDYIMFFRREVSKKVSWAGNPEKPATLGPNGIRLTPRKSFETWQSIVDGQSDEWLGAHLRSAEQLRITFLEVVLRLMEEASLERRRATEKQELLIAELNHRVRNILSLVRSLINQTRSEGMSIPDFSRVLDSRIQSLARAHDQITKDNWSPASLRLLIETEAEAYLRDDGAKVTVTGDDVLLVPTAYSSVALVLHELVTNSAKYGALSDRSGIVGIALDRQPDRSIVMRWQESGGPPVQAPTRKGFGTTIIERAIPFELQGRADVEFRLAGLHATFQIPAAHVRDTPSAQPQKPAPPAPAERKDRHPFARNVLLVEDNFIIAMDGEEDLRRLGAKQVTICADVKSALDAIGRSQFDFALLDFNLGSTTSLPVALALEKHNIPFIFATGYGDNSILPEEFRDRIVISKPYDVNGIRSAWDRLTGDPSAAGA